MQAPGRALIDALKLGTLDPMASELEGLRRDLYWTAVAVLGNVEDANDAVAETLYKIWHHIRSLKDPGHFEGWCRQILINECRRIWRSQRDMPVDPQTLPALALAHDDQADLEGMDILREMLDHLNEGERAVVVLRYMHDHSLETIGEMLDIPIGTVKSRLSRAHARLKAALPGEKGAIRGA